MAEANYWTKRVPRRMVIRGAGLGAAGLAGAALLGCGTAEEEVASQPIAGTSSFAVSAGDALPVPPPAGKVGKDQIRVKPGPYQGSPPMTPAETDPMANARYGGTLAARYLDPPSMDFNRTLSCTVNTTMDYTKNKLVRGVFGPKANPALIHIEPDLAEKWEVSPDNTVFTFHLRRGAKFHNVAPVNGREFTSADVKASVERYQAGGVQKDVWEPAVSVETSDAYTVKIALSEPVVDFPRNIAAWSHIDALEMVNAPDVLKEKAVGTGPFIQTEWTRKERSIFTKHPDYWEEGLPFLDRVVTVVQNDTAVLRAGFQTDNFFDWSARDDSDAADQLNKVKDAAYMKYTSAQGVNISGYHFQMKNPKWQDVRVRRAFSLALDRKEFDLARYIGEGGGYSKGPIAWQVLYQNLPTLESQGPWYQYDPKQASQLLQAAGYSAANPITADAPVWYSRDEYQSIMRPMYEKVPELKFNIRIVDNPTAVQMLNDRAYEDTMNVTWGPPAYSVDQVTYPWYHSKGGLNHANVNDAEMDRLLVAQRRETNAERQRDLWKQIEARYFDQVWQVFYPVGIFGRGFWHNYVVNFRYHGIASFVCYGNAQARSIWLDEGAPNVLAMPEFRDVAQAVGLA